MLLTCEVMNIKYSDLAHLGLGNERGQSKSEARVYQTPPLSPGFRDVFSHEREKNRLFDSIYQLPTVFFFLMPTITTLFDAAVTNISSSSTNKEKEATDKKNGVGGKIRKKGNQENKKENK